MEILPYVYLTYMFISLYMLSLFLLIYIQTRKSLFVYPKSKQEYSISFIVPAYNEEKTIRDTIKHIFGINYKDILEVIIVNDRSSDNTLEIAKQLAKKYSKIKILDNKENLGKAGSLNKALNIAKGELIAVVDADSYPEKESLNKMIGFFDNLNVGAVTCPIIVRNKNKFFEKLQYIEYKVIALSRKLLDYVDAIYVTPGPLALYRRKALTGIKGFDAKNLTEDIEATWHLIHDGWERRMCLSTKVTTTVPTKFRSWFVQRRRWNIGGLQCISKYRYSLGKKGMLGWFIMPFFILNTFLGLVGLSIFFYLLISRIISNFLLTKYSILVGTPILSLNDLYITPSILNYLGVILFILGLIFTLLILFILNEKILKKENILNIPFYMTIYLISYPFIMINAIWYFINGKMVWR
jgi:cellulose synthase/poly-beta-1,6-N-acetylglucosamine synthase-like glycosyltransferase